MNATTSGTVTVFRSTDRLVVAAYALALGEIGAYQAQVRKVLARLGLGSREPRWTRDGRPGRFGGITLPSGDVAPDGWRRIAGSNVAVIDRDTETGRETAKCIDGVRYPGDPRERLPGMPVHAPGRDAPSVEACDGGVTVTFSCDMTGCPDIDRTLWVLAGEAAA